jgi:DNA processing protein
MESASPVLTESERRDRLRLYRSENVGSATFFRLLEHFGSASRALDMLAELAKKGGAKRPLRIVSSSAIDDEMLRIRRLGATLLVHGDPAFPHSLAAAETVPVLIARGHPHLLTRPGVAIVGARNASAVGRKFARMLSADLGHAGMVVVSGMARGIDSAAHEGALETGTVAVLAGGVDDIYPPENAGLYERIVASGCVISEMPPGTKPQASHFPRRNRLISGLAMGVVVVEASMRSGSLITARLALEQGREVFAVPGSPLDPRAQGPNALIKQGAMLTESAADVLAVLKDMLRQPLAEPSRPDYRPDAAIAMDESELASARRSVASSLGPTPVTVDELIRQCQLSPAVMSMVLLELELAGRLERHPGNQVSGLI